MSLSTDPLKYRHFMLYTGYVENNSIAPLIVSQRFTDVPPNSSYDTWQEAWEFMFLDFRRLFAECVKLDNGLLSDIHGSGYMRNIDSCCKSFLKKSKMAFCPTCGTKLDKYRQSDLSPEENVSLCYQLVANLVASTYNSANSDFWDLMDANGWYMPGGFSKGFAGPGEEDIVTVVYERAELLLGDYDGSKKDPMWWNPEKKFWRNVHFGTYRQLEWEAD